MRRKSLVALIFIMLKHIASSKVIDGTKSIKQDGTFELLILHNNDMHARFEQTSRYSGTCTIKERELGKCFGGFPRVATVVKEARAAAVSGEGPDVLYLNAGDTYTGTVWFSIYKWQIAAECLNKLRPDAVSLGNHEFDNGVSGLTPFIENLKSPVLAANIDLHNEPTLAAENNLKKSTVFTYDDIKVGVIGYLTPDTKFLSKRNKVEYIDEVTSIREEAQRLKSEGVNILIALGHSGYLKDIEIARNVEDIDLVIGGHTNTFLWNGQTPDVEIIQGPYPTMVTQTSGRIVPVVQAYAYTKYLGKLHVAFDSNGELISHDGQPILLDNSIKQDEETLQLIDRYRSRVEKVADEIVGQTVVKLDGDCRLKECNMGNLVTDAVHYKYAIEYNGDTWTDAPITLLPGGTFRATIDRQDRVTNITRGDVLTVLPFEDALVVVSVNGSTLLQVLEHSVAGYDPIAAHGRFLQMSGVRIQYDLQKANGSRLVEALVRCWSCSVPQFYTIEADREYKFITTNFIANGGDDYTMLVSGSQSVLTLNYTMVDALIEYLNRRSPVYPEEADRIVLLNEPVIISGTIKSSVSLLLLIMPFLILFRL